MGPRGVGAPRHNGAWSYQGIALDAVVGGAIRTYQRGSGVLQGGVTAGPYEPPLLEALARWRSDCLPQLLSVNSERGWVLMRDGGPMLRDTIRSTRDIRSWMPVLPRYAEFQMEMVGRVPELLTLGVLDRRLSVLPFLYKPLLADSRTAYRPTSGADLRAIQATIEHSFAGSRVVQRTGQVPDTGNLESRRSW